MHTKNTTESAPRPLLDFSGSEPWFAPKQFWKYWAAYYPITWQGWMVTLIIFVPLLLIAFIILIKTDSLILSVVRFLPFLLIGLVIYDNITLGRGIYPSWWKGRRKKNKKIGV